MYVGQLHPVIKKVWRDFLCDSIELIYNNSIFDSLWNFINKSVLLDSIFDCIITWPHLTSVHCLTHRFCYNRTLSLYPVDNYIVWSNHFSLLRSSSLIKFFFISLLDAIHQHNTWHKNLSDLIVLYVYYICIGLCIEGEDVCNLEHWFNLIETNTPFTKTNLPWFKGNVYICI